MPDSKHHANSDHMVGEIGLDPAFDLDAFVEPAPLRMKGYTDATIEEECEVVYNELYAGNRFMLKIKSSAILPLIQPGHTIYLRIPGMEGRAVKTHFPVFDVDEDEGTMSVLYFVAGYATACMVRVLKGHLLHVEGPLDNPWPVQEGAKRVLMYGDEMGPARLSLLGRVLCNLGVEVDAVVEAETKGAIAAFERQMEPFGVNVLTVTKDNLGDVFGEIGRRTRLAEMLSKNAYDYVVACGSEAVLEELGTTTYVMGIPYYKDVDTWNPVTR